ncbi:MAG: dinuclear metal center YbgI/SA1388 family protein [Urechidicola sp.]
MDKFLRMTLIKNVIQQLELLAPPIYQESYDNSGLIVGDPNNKLKGILVSLDCTEDIIEEAIKRECNMVVSHHPIVFGGLKKINGKNYVERTVIKAIKHDIAIYAIHTNLDNMSHGVNNKIADKIGLINRKVLMPKSQSLLKLSFYCPQEHTEAVTAELSVLGAGKIGNYDSCSFKTSGEGSYRALAGSNPFIGNIGELHKENEDKVEMILPSHLKNSVVHRLKEVHPYEKVAYFVQSLINENMELGSGMIGDLTESMEAIDFLKKLKTSMNTDCVRHTKTLAKSINKVALVGGSGSFALGSAIAQNADIFITADFKYHEFFDAEDKIIIADIGHYESEQFTISLLVDYLKKKIPNFAVLFTEINTNPVNYI